MDTNTNIFMWIQRFATIMSHVEGAHDIKCIQK